MKFYDQNTKHSRIILQIITSFRIQLPRPRNFVNTLGSTENTEVSLPYSGVTCHSLGKTLHLKNYIKMMDTRTTLLISSHLTLYSYSGSGISWIVKRGQIHPRFLAVNTAYILHASNSILLSFELIFHPFLTHWINIFIFLAFSACNRSSKFCTCISFFPLLCWRRGGNLKMYASDLQTMIYISMDIHFNPISAGQGLIRPHNLKNL